ncbi:DUF1932 domain-containing protein [Streptomyces sp. NPDC058461]|uniref:DUF1932 domain-containing protein n=1 Tax=Streptomyces sp. NPDC058461 TaxID=3346509 RepID=UPI0036629B53
MVERDTGIMGMLHPGAMGAAVAAQAVAAGTTVRWLPAGRSAATRRRAEAIGLLPAADLRELADGCGTLVSVCPPAAGHGVLDDLLALTAHTMPETPFGSPARLTSAGAKAWRWEGEMREIARTWQQAGLPTDFADAAAGTFARWTEHKDDPEVSAARLIEDLRTE